MTKILNFGSINVDHVYRVEHFVRPGETLACDDYRRFAGGKGLNQSIALAHAGACVYHAGKVGQADVWLKNLLVEHQVDARFVEAIEGPSGHAIIQVNTAGENSIVIVGGANQLIMEADVKRIVAAFGPGDFLLVQNEVALVPQIVRMAKAQGMTVVLNPAPMSRAVLSYPLELVDLLVLNESEALSLTGESDAEKIGAVLGRRYPHAATVLTMGARGAMYFSSKLKLYQAAEQVCALDTTAAGDTFTGFFLAEISRIGDPAVALAYACRAAAICVTRPGAADSIPWRKELVP